MTLSAATGTGTAGTIRARRADAVRVAASAGAAVVGLAVLVVHDPHRQGSLGVCPVYALTGGYCPGCGSLRGLHDLATGHPLEAVGHNALLLPAIAWLVWWWSAQAAGVLGRPLRPPWSSARFCYLLLAVLVVFTVLRNLPGSPLAP